MAKVNKERPEIVSVPEEVISSKIYLLRREKVMLDRDLADLYEVETRALNQAVGRNMERFPVEFMFQLNQEEFEILKSQIVTSSWGGTRKLNICLLLIELNYRTNYTPFPAGISPK